MYLRRFAPSPPIVPISLVPPTTPRSARGRRRRRPSRRLARRKSGTDTLRARTASRRASKPAPTSTSKSKRCTVPRVLSGAPSTFPSSVPCPRADCFARAVPRTANPGSDLQLPLLKPPSNPSLSSREQRSQPPRNRTRPTSTRDTSSSSNSKAGTASPWQATSSSNPSHQCRTRQLLLPFRCPASQPDRPSPPPAKPFPLLPVPPSFDRRRTARTESRRPRGSESRSATMARTTPRRSGLLHTP